MITLHRQTAGYR
uniref:Uncharacterized protein n=1 Tax=Anguilla anguilla TaxID=7936 RepID=A0A0E9UPJ0_ANGAN